MTNDARWRYQRAHLSSVSMVALVSCASVAAAQPPTAQPPPPLSSAAVDPTVYRDGEVKRFSSAHGNWIVVCDEISRLKQRFCSLRTAIVDAAGTRVAVMTVSTGQDGRPAALVDMAATHVRGGALEIAVPKLTQAVAQTTPKEKTATQSKSKTVAPAAASTTRLRPVSCDAGKCSLIWTLKPEQLQALNDGTGLELTVTPGADLSSLAPQHSNQRAAIRLGVSAEGFKDAVGKSLQPFE